MRDIFEHGKNLTWACRDDNNTAFALSESKEPALPFPI